jgi:hypothetical protein
MAPFGANKFIKYLRGGTVNGKYLFPNISACGLFRKSERKTYKK